MQSRALTAKIISRLLETVESTTNNIVEPEQYTLFWYFCQPIFGTRWRVVEWGGLKQTEIYVHV